MPLKNLTMPDGWAEPGPITGPALVFSETTARYEYRTGDQQRADREAQQDS